MPLDVILEFFIVFCILALSVSTSTLPPSSVTTLLMARIEVSRGKRMFSVRYMVKGGSVTSTDLTCKSFKVRRRRVGDARFFYGGYIKSQDGGSDLVYSLPSTHLLTFVPARHRSFHSPHPSSLATAQIDGIQNPAHSSSP